MEIRKATKDDCRQIAELALIAGEGIPAYFWEEAKKPEQEIEEVGAARLTSETENFSYRNVHVAVVNDSIAGMLLAYRLPDDDDEDLEELPEFIRPCIELEQCVPGSFYINMLATYPEFRNRSIGTMLMSGIDQLASESGCSKTSIQVFDQNEGALRLYLRLGYSTVQKRQVIPHHCHPYTGEILLLTRPIGDTLRK